MINPFHPSFFLAPQRFDVSHTVSTLRGDRGPYFPEATPSGFGGATDVGDGNFAKTMSCAKGSYNILSYIVYIYIYFNIIILYIYILVWDDMIIYIIWDHMIIYIILYIHVWYYITIAFYVNTWVCFWQCGIPPKVGAVKLIEGSLEVKLPTIWTVEKQRWDESVH